MRARAIVASVLASVGVLAIGWEVGAAASVTSTTSVPVADPVETLPNTSPTTQASSTPTTTTTPKTTKTTTTAKSGTYTGSTVSTRYGDVQVSVTIASGTITEVTALKLTADEGRSVQISNRAAPILRSEVLASQSASVSNVSGATYTSDAYLESLQAALDAAGF